MDEPWIMTVKSTSCLKQLPEDNYNYQNKKIQQQNGGLTPSTPSLPKSSAPIKTDIPVNHLKNEKNNAVILRFAFNRLASWFYARSVTSFPGKETTTF